jgi:anti-sigma regulatory factor (Ser/Thr protein kinase)
MAEVDSDPNGVVLELNKDLDAPAVARRFVAEQGSGLSPAVVADAELLVSELVTNAVVYGRAAITLRVNLDPPGIGIAVHDRGDDSIEVAPDPPDPNAPGGRGLLIVRTIATAWGVTPSDPPPGKTVWFRLEPGLDVKAG